MPAQPGLGYRWRGRLVTPSDAAVPSHGRTAKCHVPRSTPGVGLSPPVQILAHAPDLYNTATATANSAWQPRSHRHCHHHCIVHQHRPFTASRSPACSHLSRLARTYGPCTQPQPQPQPQPPSPPQPQPQPQPTVPGSLVDIGTNPAPAPPVQVGAHVQRHLLLVEGQADELQATYQQMRKGGLTGRGGGSFFGGVWRGRGVGGWDMQRAYLCSMPTSSIGLERSCEASMPSGPAAQRPRGSGIAPAALTSTQAA